MRRGCVATKRSMNNIFILTLVCIVLFLGSIQRLYSGTEDIKTMTLHHLQESSLFLVV